MEHIAERCIQLVAGIKKIPAADVSLGTTFEELEFDSLDNVSLAFDIEESFGIEIPESHLALITNVAEMVDGVSLAVATKSGTSPGAEG